MKRLISDLLPATLLFAAGTCNAMAQTGTIIVANDSILTAESDTLTTEKAEYDKSEKLTNWYKARWAALIPNRFSLQYAGDIGMVSAGIGWCYGKRGQWGTHVFLGYLPKNHTPSSYWSFTVKQTYTPWSLPLGKQWTVEPLYGTVFINSILSDEFWTKEPDRYPKGYYGFSSRLRFHIGMGQKVTFTIPASRRVLAKKISLYYEVSTCDLYVRQKFLSKTIPFKDIICLALGVQYTIL
ncbi:MAG: hypothetical protein NC116_10865 [Clostridium sp.]|nr:hypothetical protein [Bacteroidales bacterium]MCM1511198.1 hypothetical protein [Clostridium sp.]